MEMTLFLICGNKKGAIQRLLLI